MTVFKYLPLLAALPLTLAGCGGGGGGGSSSSASAETGSFSLSLIDAPVDGADAVVVEFTGVELKPADGESVTITFDAPVSIDLLAQQNGNSASLVSDEALPAGNYNWIRLAVNAEEDSVFDSYIEISGTQHELDIPSGSQSGLKLNSGFTVTASGNADYTIDFDLRKSITLANGDYKLRPSLRLIDNTTTGSISGEVDSTLLASACADASLFAGAVYVFSGLDVTPDDIDGDAVEPTATASVSLDDDSNGYSYNAAFLETGDYTVAYSCDNDDADTDEVLTFSGTTNVTLADDAEEVVNFQ